MSDGEEWKGEPEMPAFGSVFFSIGPRTPEEAEAQRKAFAERVAKGRMLAATLVRFREDARCPKCGKQKVGATYCDGKTGGKCVDHVGDIEHLHRECKRCYFMWYERPLDAED